MELPPPLPHPQKQFLSFNNEMHYINYKAKLQILIDLPESIRRKSDKEGMGFWKLANTSFIGRLEFVISISNVQSDSCEYILSDNQTISFLQKEQFDVGISEVFALCGFGLFELVKIPNMIGASAVGVIDVMNEAIEVPIMPSFMPSFLTTYGESMTFPQRFFNFFLHGAVWIATQNAVRKYERIFMKHGLQTSLRELIAARSNYVLSNSDEFLDYAFPTSGKLVHVGGIALPQVTKLDEKFRLIMERHDSKGVVLISFGSNAPTVQMPSNIRLAILDAVATFQNYTFIWKIDKNDTVPTMKNLFTTSWLPQNALLGLNSVLELTRNGKPSILVPLFGDQHRNAKLVERRGSAIVIYMESFTSEIFIRSLRSILEDSVYRQKAERLSSLMTRKPFSPKERLLSTVEFSAVHGKIKELVRYSYRMGFVEYFCLDVILVALMMVALTISAFTYCIRKLLKNVISKTKID
ncbi:UDP-glucoronosyl and UDP-glucosyl transferase [Cooperia oncophora]